MRAVAAAREAEPPAAGAGPVRDRLGRVHRAVEVRGAVDHSGPLHRGGAAVLRLHRRARLRSPDGPHVRAVHPGENSACCWRCLLRSASPTQVRVKAFGAAVARNLPPASLEVLAKPRFLPGFQRFREVLAEILGQRTEVNSLLACAGRAGPPARATALSDGLFYRGSVRGSRQGLDHGCKREPRDPGKGHRVGVTSDGADNAPRLRV